MASERRPIRVLDEHMINLIAAGEVVERSASVVKELVENAIDAGANQITINLVDAGLKEITVLDNGCGMDEEDLKVAILPHSTSKIQKETDLFNIATLGFRGEALASILSVSKAKIKSSTGNGKGVMLGVIGGQISSFALIGFPKGTEIQIRNLFFNTPARLQNLKSEAVELGYVTDFVTKIAIANAGIAFKLYNNEKLLFQSFGSGNMLEVISQVYDNEVAKNMINISGDSGLFKIYGYTSNLQVTRSSKNNITIIVNGRVVRNNNVINACIAGYNTLLTVGRFPITVIDILVDYGVVDVNVHPTKSEVRFSDEGVLIDLIKDTINHCLLNSNLIINDNQDIKKDSLWDEISYEEPDDKEINSGEIENFDENDEKIDEKNENEDLEEENDDFIPDFLLEVKDEFTKDNDVNFEEKDVNIELHEEKDSYLDNSLDNSENQENKEKPVQMEIDFTNIVAFDGKVDKLQLKKLYYIGQLFNTYILAQNDEGFYIIDQHAADERINYELILKELQNQNVVSYEVMFPLKLQFSLQESILIKEKNDELSELGIDLDDFGGGTFIVRMVPVWMNRGNVSEYVENVINNVINNKKTNRIEFLDNMAKSMACKRSIKGNEYVSPQQVDALLTDLVKCENPFTCPHGRPIIVRYSKQEIEKWFKRINE